MMTLTCRDMGVDCPHIIRGETEEEVMERAMEHGEMEHKEKMDEMRKKYSEDEIRNMMKANIKEE